MKKFNVCVPVIEMSFDELDAIDRRLVDEAREATDRAYAPYSKVSRRSGHTSR